MVQRIGCRAMNGEFQLTLKGGGYDNQSILP